MLYFQTQAMYKELIFFSNSSIQFDICRSDMTICFCSRCSALRTRRTRRWHASARTRVACPLTTWALCAWFKSKASTTTSAAERTSPTPPSCRHASSPLTPPSRSHKFLVHWTRVRMILTLLIWLFFRLLYLLCDYQMQCNTYCKSVRLWFLKIIFEACCTCTGMHMYTTLYIGNRVARNGQGPQRQRAAAVFGWSARSAGGRTRSAAGPRAH